MIGAADGAFEPAGLIDQNHTAMPADILEHPDIAGAIAHQQERLAHEIDGFDRARFWHVFAKANASPAMIEERPPFGLIPIGVDIVAIGQAAGLGHRLQNICQICHCFDHRASPTSLIKRRQCTEAIIETCENAISTAL